MNTDPLAQFTGQKYLNIETYRRTGTPVATPVWFAEDGGTLYIYSMADAGKVKRIRNNPRVRIVPCDLRGKPTGLWLDARAQVLDGPAVALGHRLLDRKYGWLKRPGNFFSRLLGRQRVVIAITIA
jgi:PPOX class probable F420-dependent enzyme